MGKVDLAGKLYDARARVEAETPAGERGVAKFARLTRKDARIRPDQDVALTALAKSLMRVRQVKTERITENTLIRVAIDLLLVHAADLHGSTEQELRTCVTPAVPNRRSSGLPDSRTPEPRNSRSSDLPDLRSPGVPDFPTSGVRR